MDHPYRRTLASGLLLALVAGAAAAQPPASLPELIGAALASHEAMQRAESRLRRADADVRLSTAALLPRVELNGGFTRYQDEAAVEFSPGESFVIRPVSDWFYSADVRQTLFYGLRDWRARRVAASLQDAARIDRAVVASDLALQVSEAFFDAVAAAQRVEVAQAALEQAEAQERVARRRFEVGEVASADAARWRARAAAERQGLVAAEGVAELARRRLGRVAGVDELGPLTPPGPVPVPAGEAAALAEAAIAQRRVLSEVAERLRAYELIVKVEQGARLPELSAHAQYYAQKSEFPAEDWMSLNLSLRVPVYDGGVTAARVAKAREDVVELRALQQELEKVVRDQVEAASIGYAAADAALVAARDRLEASQEAFRQTERAYRVGEATATDLLQATAELSDARTSEVIARWQRALQAIALRHAVGEPLLPGLDVTPAVALEPAPR